MYDRYNYRLKKERDFFFVSRFIQHWNSDVANNFKIANNNIVSDGNIINNRNIVE